MADTDTLDPPETDEGSAPASPETPPPQSSANQPGGGGGSRGGGRQSSPFQRGGGNKGGKGGKDGKGKGKGGAGTTPGQQPGAKPSKGQNAAGKFNAVADKVEKKGAEAAGEYAGGTAGKELAGRAVDIKHKIEKKIAGDNEETRTFIKLASRTDLYPVYAILILILILIMIVFIFSGISEGKPEDGPKLTVTKSGPDVGTIGVPIQYTINAAYPGAATELTVTDRIPDGADYVSASGTGHYDPATRIVTWKASENGGLSGANASMSLTLNVVATIDNTYLINQAEANVVPAAGGGGSCGPPQAPPASIQTTACTGLAATEKTTDGYYLRTSFGCNNGFPDDPGDNCVPACGVETIPECAGIPDGPTCERKLEWYAANTGQYGCNTKLRVTNPETGQGVVVRAIDVGPNCSVQGGGAKFDMSQASSAHIGDPEKVKVDVVDESVPLGPAAACVAGAGYIPPSQDTCGGQYDLNNPAGGNFGDPACNFDKNALFEMLKQQDPANAEAWFGKIIPCESSFNPTTYASHASIGTPDAAGAWGLYQMGSSKPPGSPPPSPGKNGEFDRGDVNWPVQTSNAITYSKNISSLGAYWACAR